MTQREKDEHLTPPARIVPTRTQIERLEKSLQQSTRKMMESAGVQLSTPRETVKTDRQPG
jgi:hypothetical protein